MRRLPQRCRQGQSFCRDAIHYQFSELGEESNCMECHQGRASALQVSETIAGHPRDTVNTELSLPNIHNNAAGPTFYGAEAKGGAEYLDLT